MRSPACIPLLRVLAFALGSANAAAQGAPAAIEIRTHIWETPDDFGAISSLVELPDGSVILADRAENVVVRLGPNGNRLGVLSRVGAGPGEYGAVGWLLSLGRDSTLLTDSYSSRWLVFAGSDFVAGYAESREINRMLDAELVGVDEDGFVYGVIPRRNDGTRVPRVQADTLILVRAPRSGGRGDTLARLRGLAARSVVLPPTGGRPRSVVLGTGLEVEDRAVVMHDGSVAVVSPQPYRVLRLSARGVAVVGPELDRTGGTLTRGQFCEAVRARIGLSRAQCDRVAAMSDIDRLPAFFAPTNRDPAPAVQLGPDGQIFVRRAVLPTETQRYDVLSREGNLLSILQLKPGEAIVGFGRGSIYVAVQTRDETRALRKYALPSAGGASR